MNSKSAQESTAQMFFEDYGVPSLYISSEAVLSLFNSGRTTGLVFNAGSGSFQVVPVYEGHSVQHGINRVNLSGKGLTSWLEELLNQSGIELKKMKNEGDRRILEKIKEDLCYVAFDYQDEVAKFEKGESKTSHYKLPDEHVVTLGSELITSPEALFTPDLLGGSFAAVHQTAVNSIQKCDVDLRKQLFRNITLSGGSSMFSGIKERLANEIIPLAPHYAKVNILAPNDREYSTWTGGSILSIMNSFQNRWLKRANTMSMEVSSFTESCSKSLLIYHSCPQMISKPHN